MDFKGAHIPLLRSGEFGWNVVSIYMSSLRDEDWLSLYVARTLESPHQRLFAKIEPIPRTENTLTVKLFAVIPLADNPSIALLGSLLRQLILLRIIKVQSAGGTRLK